MSASYPSSIATLQNPVSAEGLDQPSTGVPHSVIETRQNEEIVALETELGLGLKGSKATLLERLAVAINPDGTLNTESGFMISWGNIGGTLSSQIDLYEELEDKDRIHDFSNPSTELRASRHSNQTQTGVLSSAGHILHNVFYLNGYFYGGQVYFGDHTPDYMYIVKIEKNDISQITKRQVDTKLGGFPKVIYVKETDKIYALSDVCDIYEIDPVTLDWEQKVVGNTVSNFHSMTCDGTYIYICTWEDITKVYKYSMSTWELVAQTTITALLYSTANGHAMSWDGKNLFVTGCPVGADGWLAKMEVDLSYTTVRLIGLSTPTNLMATDGDYVYISPELTRKFAIVNKKTLEVISFAIPKQTWGAFWDRNFCWFIGRESNRLFRLDVHTFTLIEYVLQVPTAGTAAVAMASDGYGLFIVTGAYGAQYPADLMKISYPPHLYCSILAETKYHNDGSIISIYDYARKEESTSPIRTYVHIGEGGTFPYYTSLANDPNYGFQISNTGGMISFYTDWFDLSNRGNPVSFDADNNHPNIYSDFSPMESNVFSIGRGGNIWKEGHFAELYSSTLTVSSLETNKLITVESGGLLVSSSYSENDFFLLDQTTPQTVFGDAPTFSLGLNVSGANLNFETATGDQLDTAYIGGNYNSIYTGLVGYWNFNEASGDAYDASGNGLTLTNNGGTRAALKLGNGVTFVAGSSQYMSIANTIFATAGNPWSISFWGKFNSTGTHGIFGIYGDTRLWAYFDGTTAIRVSYNTAGNPRKSASMTSNLVLHHYVILWNGTVITNIYIDGVDTALSDASGYSAPTVNQTDIGRAHQTIYGSTSIDEFGLWNRTLTTSEIAVLYNSGLGADPTYQPIESLDGEITLTAPRTTINSPVSINGTTYLSKYLGIGVAVPSYPLDVLGILRFGASAANYVTMEVQNGAQLLFTAVGTNPSVAFNNDLYIGSAKAIYSYDGTGSYIGINSASGTQKLFTTSGSNNKDISISPANAVAMTLKNGGNVGIGVTSPTAILHLKAGTATASTAPLKFNSGTLNTAAEAGAMEFLTDDYYATITTGAARKKFVLDDGTNLVSGDIPYVTTNGRLKSQTPVANGTYTVGSALTPGVGVNGTITITNGVISAVQQAT